MSQGGFAIVDVDDEPGDISGQTDDLQFKTFLGSEGSSRPTSSHALGQTEPASVPFSLFNIAYYQTYFDVDTNTVLKRVALSMLPRANFITEACNGSIDLYGPFWTLTTLVLVLYTTSTLTSSITQYLSHPDQHVTTNLPLLSTALSVVYVYGLLVPALLWGVTRWLGIGDWSVAEALGTYGYAMSVFVPIGFLCLIPIGILRWALVAAGAGSSGFFLVQNVYPVLQSADNKLSKLLILVVVGLHVIVALSMKILFFSYAVAGVIVGPDLGDGPLDS